MNHPASMPASGGLMDPWADYVRNDSGEVVLASLSFLPLFPCPKGPAMTNPEAGVMLAWLERLRKMSPPS